MQLIGSRIWRTALQFDEGEPQPLLLSFNANYVWQSTTVGHELDYLLNPHNSNYAGFDKKNKTYLTAEEISERLPKWDSADERWDSPDALRESTPGLLIWEWESMDNIHVPEYGFYAYRNIYQLIEGNLREEFFSNLFGLVSGYGKLHRHSRGFRSEYMSILAFFIEDEYADYPIDIFDESGTFIEDYDYTVKDYVELASEYYNIPVVSFDEAKRIEMSYVYR
jgi:hypothetical protein